MKGNSKKHRVKLVKARVRYLYFEKPEVNGWTTKAQRNANPVNDIQTKIQPEQRQYLSETEDDERMASGWMTVWRLDTGAKAIRKDAVKMVETTVLQLRRYHQGKRRNRGVERAYEELKMYGEEYHFAVIHVDGQRPSVIFIAVDQAGNRRKKDVIGDKKKMRRTQEKFLKQCRKGLPSLNLLCWSRKA